MKRTKFSDEQIIKAIKRHESGEKSVDLCRDLGISQATFYKWNAKFGGMDVSEAQKMRGYGRGEPPFEAACGGPVLR